MRTRSPALPYETVLEPSAVKRRRAYTEYIQSAPPWLGRIPAHWALKRLKFSVSVFSGGTPSMANPEYWDGEIPWVSPKDMYTQSITDTQDHITVLGLAESSSRLVGRNAVLMVVRSGILAHSIPVAINAVPVAINQDIRAIVPRPELTARFLMYLVIGNQRPLLREWAKHGTTVQSIETEYLLNGLIPVPPLPEQQAIAAFLDRETAKIDALVEKKRRLIELLKEKRAALISHAVTKGLNPDAPMKDSGIEWLGQVPEHWGLARFGAISWVVRGASPRPAGDPTYFFGDHIPWITVGEVTKDSSRELFDTETMLTEEGRRRSRVFARRTLVLTNSGATLGVPKILAIDGCANDGIVGFLNVSARADIEYLYYYLASLTGMFRDRIRQGCGQPNLNTDIVRATPVLLPPVAEQRRIVDVVEASLSQLHELQVKIEAAIDRLLEYRTALISAAVTGKIDVRGEV